MVTCGYCGKEVPQQEGKRRREYCDNGGVCKQLAYRKRKQADAPIKQPVNEALEASYTEMLAELVELRTTVESQALTIELLKQSVQEHIGERDQQRRRMTNLLQELKEAQDQAQRIADLEAKNLDLQKTLERERKDRNSYQEQASENVQAWMQENVRLKQEIARLTEENQLIEDLQGQVADLRQRLENEKDFLGDTKARYFKSWLKKQPVSPWRTRFLSDQLVPARGTHGHYRAQMNRLQMTEEEHEDFTRLWKLFVLER